MELILACAGVEADSIISVLRILPKLYVAMVEDVSVQVHIVKALGRENHAHIIPRVKQRQRLIEELDIGNLQAKKGSSEPHTEIKCHPIKRETLRAKVYAGISQLCTD